MFTSIPIYSLFDSWACDSWACDSWAYWLWRRVDWCWSDLWIDCDWRYFVLGNRKWEYINSIQSRFEEITSPETTSDIELRVFIKRYLRWYNLADIIKARAEDALKFNRKIESAVNSHIQHLPLCFVPSSSIKGKLRWWHPNLTSIQFRRACKPYVTITLENTFPESGCPQLRLADESFLNTSISMADQHFDNAAQVGEFPLSMTNSEPPQSVFSKENTFDAAVIEVLRKDNRHAYSTIWFIHRSLMQFNLAIQYYAYEIFNEAYLRGRELIRSGGNIRKPYSWLKSTSLNIIREISRRQQPIKLEAFHYEPDGYQSIKFSFYLNDAAPSSGTRVYMRGSHKNKRFLHQLLGVRYASKPDQEIVDCCGAEELKTLCGLAGLRFARDVRCFHKGTLLTTKNAALPYLEWKIPVLLIAF